MAKLAFYHKVKRTQGIFPWAHENFSSYLNSESPWLKNYPSINLDIKRDLDFEFNSKELLNFSRNLEHNYELANNLVAYDWDTLIIEDESRNLFYLGLSERSNISLANSVISNKIEKYKYTIIQEPFYLNFREGSNLTGSDWSCIAPSAELLIREKEYINKLTPNKYKVGLHIRRGDYKEWNNGKYYYSDEFWIKKAINSIDKGNAVWIFSNDLSENLNSKLIEIGAYISNSSYESDFTRLMLMDKVYGPPSTFSVMAVNIAKAHLGLNVEFNYVMPDEVNV